MCWSSVIENIKVTATCHFFHLPPSHESCIVISPDVVLGIEVSHYQAWLWQSIYSLAQIIKVYCSTASYIDRCDCNENSLIYYRLGCHYLIFTLNISFLVRTAAMHL